MEKQQDRQIELPRGARIQQVDPDTGEFYPWWVRMPNQQGAIKFDPNRYEPRRAEKCYKTPGKTFKLESNPTCVFEDAFDTENLRFIDPQSIRDALENIIQQYDQYPDKKIIVVIGTGGTISMLSNRFGQKEAKLNAEALVSYGGQKAKKFTVTSIDFPTPIDSSQMEIDYAADLTIAMSGLYRLLEQKDSNREKNDKILPHFAGFIICHGTDTAVQSQTYTSFMLGSGCPFNMFYVVAQKSIDEPFNDVGANLELTFSACDYFSDEQRDIGIHGICAGGTSGGVYNGPTSKKCTDTKVSLFEDFNHGGRILSAEDFAQEQNVLFFEMHERYHRDFAGGRGSGIGRIMPEISRRSVAKPEFLPVILRGHNLVVKITPEMGDDPETYARLVRSSTERAVLIETFGSFTVNRKIIEAIVQAARKEGKLVFATNPFPEGSTDHTYVDTQYLKSQGIIPLKMLSHAAYAKLLYVLSVFGDDAANILQFMTNNNFRNEQLYEEDSAKYNRCKTYDNCVPINSVDEFTRRMKILRDIQYINKHDYAILIAMNDPELRSLIEENRRLFAEILGEIIDDIFVMFSEPETQKAFAREGKECPRAVDSATLKPHIDQVSTAYTESFIGNPVFIGGLIEPTTDNCVGSGLILENARRAINHLIGPDIMDLNREELSRVICDVVLRTPHSSLRISIANQIANNSCKILSAVGGAQHSLSIPKIGQPYDVTANNGENCWD